ncbi:glycosyltransferase family 2 protein [Granulicella tundricola]|uniref:glycosyltransferase family 2 protein n=1 Tax=Granulicella tundricola TaxID=940615 RepID=UPI000320DAE9|nr:glycosyltransferase family 2 protein [Granulicella tundricola]
MAKSVFDVSIIIVSFNTQAILRECLESVFREAHPFRAEVFVVDNASMDGSAEMVERQFPAVRLIRSEVNLGFGGANNLALKQARGRFFVLLNSDAFFAPGALALALEHMEETPDCALGGCLLVGRDGSSQPSSRCFHTVIGDAIVLTGLAAKFPKSRILGRFDRTWADESVPSKVDWVPGAFSIVRPEALRQVGLFDPDFFLYYEEVDLCLRMKRAGLKVWYWPDVVVTHVGGESSRQLKSMDYSSPASQVVKWRMRSTLLYYRKHHGSKALLAKWLEKTLYWFTILRNRWSGEPWRQRRANYNRSLIRLMDEAWKDTQGGRVSPARPW